VINFYTCMHFLGVSDIVIDVGIGMISCRWYATYLSGTHADLCRDLGKPSISCLIGSPGLSHAPGFEHPASTLPTRFPAALGIGHGLPAA